MRKIIIGVFVLLFMACAVGQVINTNLIAAYYSANKNGTTQVYPADDWDFVKQLENNPNSAKVVWVWTNEGSNEAFGVRLTGYDSGKDVCGLLWTDVELAKTAFDEANVKEFWYMDCDRYQQSLESELK